MAIVDAINVKCDGQTVTEIVDGSGQTLKTLSAEVENADQYYKPDVINAGGELEAGSTIAAGTYFSGAATVPSGGLEDGQTAVYDIPNGKILSTQIVLSEITIDSTLSATLTLPNSLSGILPDYLIAVSNVHLASANTFSFKFTAKIGGVYSSVYGGLWRSNANQWSNLSSSSMAMDALVEGTTLTIRTGPNQISEAYKWAAGTVTLYAIYTSDDAS